jgi:hypothetical protein
MSAIVEVTEKDLDIIFAPMHHDFHCNILFCGFITEDAGQALEHMQTQHGTELDMMAADLEAFQSGEREMFRLTPEQMKEIEAERPGEDVIAPYIAF